MTRILVTGATGFVGRALVQHLAAAGAWVRLATRQPPASLPAGAAEAVSVGEIGPATQWQAALEGVEQVVHLAARVHVMDDRAADPLAAFRQVNRDGTRRLAESAAAAGVTRLVFASSLKAMAEGGREQPWREDEAAAPGSPYGLSKWEAEQALQEIGQRTGLETVVLRPPLVYGPEVKGNFLSLLRLCQRGLPLPLAAVTNRRSMVFRENLVSALALLLEHPAAAGRTFLIHDGDPWSTPELIRRLAAALGRPAPLVPVPPALLAAAAWALGRHEQWQRLGQSLTVDDRALRALGWQPPFTPDQGLSATATWFRAAG